MLALQYDEYGGPEVLHVAEAAEPHADPGQVRIRVRAASVNPFDVEVRAGHLDGTVPVEFPHIPGTDAAGVVDEVGDGVTDVAPGDRVFGLGSATFAEHAVLDDWARIPDALSFEDAGALGLVVETAARCLDLLDLSPGSTVLVDGAAGGVGTAAVQLAQLRGHTVIGAAREDKHDYLRDLGALPVSHGPGLAERVAALTTHVDGAIDLVGEGTVKDLIAITGDPRRVVTPADFTAYELGVHVADTSEGRALYALAEVAGLEAEGRFTMPLSGVFPLPDGAAAHRMRETGHVPGKVIVALP
jgi:NADPH:quinone reductase-like Zn-dependent oxidoreductase